MTDTREMARNFHSSDPEFLKNYLKGCVVVAGDCTIDINGEDLVHVAVIHDSSGFNPAAAIHVGSLCHVDSVLEEAFDALREHIIEHYPEHVKELQEEWGDEWMDILTEGFDGMAWTLPVHAAVHAICDDDRTARFVSLDAS